MNAKTPDNARIFKLTTQGEMSSRIIQLLAENAELNERMAQIAETLIMRSKECAELKARWEKLKKWLKKLKEWLKDGTIDNWDVIMKMQELESGGELKPKDIELKPKDIRKGKG